MSLKDQQQRDQAESSLDQRARRAFDEAHPGAGDAAYAQVAEDLKRELVVRDAAEADANRVRRRHSIYRDF